MNNDTSLLNFRKPRKSSLTSSSCSSDEDVSKEDSERDDIDIFERLHVDDLISHLVGDKNGYIFYQDILNVITAR